MDFFIKPSFCNHLKTKRLIKTLGYEGFYSLLCLWCYVAENKPDGELPFCDEKAIAEMANWQGDAKEFVKSLIGIGFLDHNNGIYSVHDWHEHNSWLSNHHKRKKAGKQNALKRWHKDNSGHEQLPASEAMPLHQNSYNGIKKDAVALKTMPNHDNGMVSDAMAVDPPNAYVLSGLVSSNLVSSVQENQECNGMENNAMASEEEKKKVRKILDDFLRTDRWKDDDEDDEIFLNEWKKHFDYIPKKSWRNKYFTILKIILEKRVEPSNIRNIQAYLLKMNSPVPPILDFCDKCRNTGRINGDYCDCMTGKLFQWTFEGKEKPPKQCDKCRDSEGYMPYNGGFTLCDCAFGQWKLKAQQRTKEP